MMERDEFAWLIVRAVGAIFFVFIALDVIDLLLTSLQVVTLRTEMFSGSVDEDDAINLAIRYGRLMERIWTLGIQIFLTGLCSYYCLYRGKLIHKLLIRNLPSAGHS